DNIRFEDIDFLWRGHSMVISSSDDYAIIDQRAPHAEFAGCTFRALPRPESAEIPVAIRLGGSRPTATLAPAVQIKLDRCVIDCTASAIDCRTRGPASIEICDSLCMATGPLIRLPTARPIDAPTTINLEHATVRNENSVLEIDCDEVSEAVAQISIVANAC